MRLTVCFFICALAGIFTFAAGTGITHSLFASAFIAVFAAIVIGWWILKYSVLPVDEEACSRSIKILAGVAAVIALVGIARLTVFMVDSTRTQYSFLPSSEWEVQHSCLSAYFIAAQAAKSGAIYDEGLYSFPSDPTKPRKPRLLGPFRIDVYEYPPPFLLLPAALHWLAPEFSSFRALWFGLSGAFLLFAFCLAARFLGPTLGTRALLLSPLIWLAPATLSTLQKGNVQFMVIAASIVAMMLFEKRRFAGGGAMLAFATVSKLYPGMLVVYLIARREWRAALWTMAFGAGFCLLTLAYTGWAPYQAFREHLPRLLSGESFAAFRNPAATAINISIPGIVFKLKLFGIAGMSFALTRLVGWIYTLIVIAAVVFAALRTSRDDDKALIWLSVVTLATLRSPFLPQSYGMFPAVWALTLFAAEGRRAGLKPVLWIIGAWVLLNIYWPTDWPVDARWLAIANTVPQLATLAMVILPIRRLATRVAESDLSPIPAVALS